MDLKTFIKEYRGKHFLSMQDFADKCGLSKAYISMLENGRHPQSGKQIVPTMKTYAKIAAAVGMSVNELLNSLDRDTKVDLRDSPSCSVCEQPFVYEDAISSAIKESPQLRKLFDLLITLSPEDLELVYDMASRFSRG